MQHDKDKLHNLQKKKRRSSNDITPNQNGPSPYGYWTTQKQYWPCAEYGPPPPPVVLRRQLEVGQGHRDAGRDAQQDAVDDEENAKQGVLLTAPESGEDVVQLDGDGTG